MTRNAKKVFVRLLFDFCTMANVVRREQLTQIKRCLYLPLLTKLKKSEEEIGGSRESSLEVLEDSDASLLRASESEELLTSRFLLTVIN